MGVIGTSLDVSELVLQEAALGDPEVEDACRGAGLGAPVLCTPEELLED